MIARRLGAAVLILGAGGLSGCILVGTSGVGGTGGTTSTTDATTTATTTTVSGATTDTTTGNTGPTTTSGDTGSTTSTGGGTCMAPAGDTAGDCANACGTAYDCGISTCGGTQPLCPGFKSTFSSKSQFVGDSSSNGCLENCMITPAFINLIDPSDCEQTVMNLKNSNSAYGPICTGGG